MKPADFGHAPEALTLEEYRALEAGGKITRPLTDGPMHTRIPRVDPAAEGPVSIIDLFIAQQEQQ